MAPKRKQTSMPDKGGNQPVKFYKVVALTFLFLTVALLGIVIFMSSKRATITITTKNTPIEINNNVEIGSSDQQNSIDGFVTSTYIVVSDRFSPTGNREEPGLATGNITIYNDGSLDQPLVATTRFLTPDNLLFHLKEKVVVPAGGKIEAEVYADEEGEIYNVDPIERFSIPGLDKARQKIIYGSSDETMKGGIKYIGILSQDDIDRAEKILIEKIVQQAEKDLSGLHPDMESMFSAEGVHSFETDAEIGKELSEFNLSVKASIVGIFYNKEDILEWAENMLMKRAVSDAEIVKASSEEPTVTLEDYKNFEPDKAVLKIVYTGMATLNPEGKQIQKMMFFGKSKDEVRRYLLSLNHVHGVEVKFRPAWMGTVPHVAERVNVVVKSVE